MTKPDLSQWPEEEEIMPGVYLTRRPGTTQMPRQETEIYPLLNELLTSSDLEWLQQEEHVLKVRIRALLLSNHELMKIRDEDVLYEESIQENLGVLQRQMAIVERIQKRIKEITPVASCLLNEKKEEETGDENGEEGLHL